MAYPKPVADLTEAEAKAFSKQLAKFSLTPEAKQKYLAAEKKATKAFNLSD